MPVAFCSFDYSVLCVDSFYLIFTDLCNYLAFLHPVPYFFHFLGVKVWCGLNPQVHYIRGVDVEH